MEEAAAAVDRSRGAGPPCIVETRLPNVYVDKNFDKRLGEDNKRRLGVQGQGTTLNDSASNCDDLLLFILV